MAKKKQEGTENFRSTTMGMLLYPDDENHVKAVEKIKDYNYAMILHDKDVTDDGELKKAHWHVVIKFKNACWRNAVAKELGITPNYIQNIRKEENALKYLTHENEENKYHYPIEKVDGTKLRQKLIRYIKINSEDEGEKVTELIQYIKSKQGYLTVTNFAEYCAREGYWAEFRRAGAIMLTVIAEHNEKYKIMQVNEQNTRNEGK